MNVVAFYNPQQEYPDWLQSCPKQYRLISQHHELLESFQLGMPIIGLCAAAILIRQLAPILNDKWHEPPILIIHGQPKQGFILCLLGGHHGGNHLAKIFATLWQLQPLITTATDKFGFSPDNPPENWKIRNHTHGKNLSLKLLRQQKITVFAQSENLHQHLFPKDWLDTPTSPIVKSYDPVLADLWVSPFTNLDPNHNHQPFQLCPPMVYLGVGAIQNCSFAKLEDLVMTSLSKANLALESVIAVASVNAKQNELALHQLTQKYHWHLRFFPETDLAEITVPNPSRIVEAEIGTPSVAEAAALLLAGTNATLILEKQKNTDATCAIALSQQIIAPADFIGIQAGFLSIIGLGPGDNAYRLPAATTRLARAQTIIGYGLYVDFIRNEFPQANYVTLPLGAEKKRAQTALEYSMNGQDTVLVASGDPGIYALASLVFEQAKTLKDPPIIEVIPGLTAMQMLAARVGAPMGHDFCAISLSDLLTPIKTIQTRIIAAAQSDFVIAFYNPQSETRRILLAEAINILRQYRPDNTPVIVGRQLARPNETISITPLCDFNSNEVDMFCLVMVGASNTEMFGKTHCFTPRGYTQKTES